MSWNLNIWGVLDESSTDGAECSKRVASSRVASATRSLVNTKDLQLECAVLHEALLVPVLMYGNETMLWREKERPRVRVVKMDNLRGLLGIRRMDRVQNAQIRELYKVKKGLDEGILIWFSQESLCKRVCW